MGVGCARTGSRTVLADGDQLVEPKAENLFPCTSARTTHAVPVGWPLMTLKDSSSGEGSVVDVIEFADKEVFRFQCVKSIAEMKSRQER